MYYSQRLFVISLNKLVNRSRPKLDRYSVDHFRSRWSIHQRQVLCDFGQRLGKNPKSNIPRTEIMHCIRRNADMDWVTGETLLVKTAPTCWEVNILLMWPSVFVGPWFKESYAISHTHRQVANIRRTKSQHLKYSRTVLRLSLQNPLKPDVKSRMKM